MIHDFDEKYLSNNTSITLPDYMWLAIMTEMESELLLNNSEDEIHRSRLRRARDSMRKQMGLKERNLPKGNL